MKHYDSLNEAFERGMEDCEDDGVVCRYAGNIEIEG
jgi:hypothetical protein